MAYMALQMNDLIHLFDRKQFVSINSHISNKASVKYGVPQGSVLVPLLFLIYVNDLNHAVKFCKVHYFADYLMWRID